MGFLSKIFKGVKKVANFASGSGLLSGGLSFLGGQQQNQQFQAGSQAQMDFQERMSNTAHQRQIKDLRKAGLNPILSAKYGGASSPGGAQPNVVNPIESAVSTARETGRINVANKLMEAQLHSAQETAKATAIQNRINSVYADAAGTPSGRLMILNKQYGTAGTAIHSAFSAANDGSNLRGVLKGAGKSLEGVIKHFLPSPSKAETGRNNSTSNTKVEELTDRTWDYINNQLSERGKYTLSPTKPLTKAMVRRSAINALKRN